MRGGSRSKTQVRVSNTQLRSRNVPRYITVSEVRNKAPGYSQRAYEAAVEAINDGAIKKVTAAAIIAWLTWAGYA